MSKPAGFGRPLAAFLLVLLGMVAPLTAIGAAQSEDEGLISETEYESPQFGFAVEWEEPWAALEDDVQSSRSRGDQLKLQSDGAVVQVFAVLSDGTTAEEYSDLTVEAFTDAFPDLEVLDQAGDDEVAAAIVEFTDTDDTTIRQFIETRVVSDGAAEEYLISIDLVARVADLEDELDGAQDAITLDGDPLFTALDLVEIPEGEKRDDDTETATDSGTESSTETETAPETETETDAETETESTSETATDTDTDTDTDTETSTETEVTAGDVTPQYRGGVARTGEQPGPGPEQEPATLWTYETGDDFGALSPAISGDLIFFGPNALYGVELETGDLDGSIEEDVGFVAPMATADGIVYAAWEGSAVYALDPAAKEVIWTFDTGDEALIGGAPAVDGGVVYAGTYSGDLFAIDVDDGEEIWSAEIGASVTAPALVDGVLYVAGGDPATMYAFDPENGDELWSAEYGGGTTYGAFAVADDNIYAANGDGTLYALSTEDGDELWTAELGNEDATGTPAVVDGVVYAAGPEDDFYALDAATGEELWSVQLDGTIYSQPVVADETIFVGDGEGTLYALATADGDELWTVRLDGPVEGSPVILDGVIYVGGNGTIYALGES